MNLTSHKPERPAPKQQPGIIALHTPSVARPETTFLWDHTLLDRLTMPISRIHE